MPRLIRSTSSSPNVLGQRLATEMLESDVADLETGGSPSILSTIKGELRRRRDAMVEMLRSAGFTIESRHDEMPQGGIALLARLPEGVEDDIAFIDTAIAMGCFSAIPGSAFGAPGCVRFGYAGISTDGISQLARSIPDVMDALR
jgi:aspartate/methionine/tyrosine aminotransferase